MEKDLNRNAFFGIVGVYCIYFGAMMQAGADAVIWPVFCADLNIGSGYTLAITMTSLFSAVLTPVAVHSSLFVSKKNLFLCSSLFYCLFSTAQAFVTSLLPLILLRSLIGVCVGFMLTMLYALIADVIPAKNRGFYLGMVSTVMCAASVAAPLVSVYILETFSAFYWFGAVIPFAALGLPLCAVFLPGEREQGTATKPDYIGTFALCFFLACFYLLISLDGSVFAHHRGILFLLITGIVLGGALFFGHRRRAGDAGILPRRVLKDDKVRHIVIASFFAAVTAATFYYLTSYYMLSVLGATKTQVGIAIGLQSVISVFLAPGAGKALNRKGAKNPMIHISGFVTVGLYLIFAIWCKVMPPVLIYLAMFLFGGFSMVISVIYFFFAENHVKKEHRLYAVAGVRLSQSFGNGMGLAVFSAVLNRAFDLSAGFSLVFLISAVAGVLAVLFTLRIEVTEIES